MACDDQAERARLAKELDRARGMKRMFQRRRTEADRGRRTMIAVHVPWEYAEAVNDAAAARNMSAYRFMKEAVDRAMEER